MGSPIWDREALPFVLVFVLKFLDEELGFLMFTPQRKGWSPSPRYGDGVDNRMTTPAVNTRTGSGVAFLKGKGKSAVEALPPPPPLQALLGENGSIGVVDQGDAEVWRSFREAGLLDESSLQSKDRDALVQRISELEKEVSGHIVALFACCLNVLFMQISRTMLIANVQILVLIMDCII